MAFVIIALHPLLAMKTKKGKWAEKLNGKVEGHYSQKL